MKGRGWAYLSRSRPYAVANLLAGRLLSNSKRRCTGTSEGLAIPLRTWEKSEMKARQQIEHVPIRCDNVAVSVSVWRIPLPNSIVPPRASTSCFMRLVPETLLPLTMGDYHGQELPRPPSTPNENGEWAQ